MIPGERIYLIPYYHQFLKKGPVDPGEIISPLDREGEWLRQGILYHTENQDYVIVAVKTATRESLITLMQRGKQRNKPNLQMVEVCLKVDDAVVQAAEKLGLSIFKFPSDPKLPPIPCSTCGKHIDPAQPPWRCKECAEAFSGEYRLVICHKCALPFRTSPNLEHTLAERLKETGVWRVEILCPDCRLSSEEVSLLKFDGTLKSLILWALLRGHIKLETLSQMGVPTDYTNRVVRPEFLKLMSAPKGPRLPDASDKVTPTMISGTTKRKGGVGLGERDEGSTVEISTNVAVAMGTPETAQTTNVDPVEMEIEALNTACLTGITREPNEDPREYIHRALAVPSADMPVDSLSIVNAIEEDLSEAHRKLTKESLESLFRAEGDVAGELMKKTGIYQEPGESLRRYLKRLRTMLTPEAVPEEGVSAGDANPPPE